MTAEIGDFSPLYLQRITQLTNKSNQFNFTTKRYTAEQMEAVYNSDEYKGCMESFMTNSVTTALWR
jgi:predicted enzyme involved in methoxymalonyl-ACP biosynthesis